MNMHLNAADIRLAILQGSATQFWTGIFVTLMRHLKIYTRETSFKTYKLCIKAIKCICKPRKEFNMLQQSSEVSNKKLRFNSLRFLVGNVH